MLLLSESLGVYNFQQGSHSQRIYMLFFNVSTHWKRPVSLVYIIVNNHSCGGPSCRTIRLFLIKPYMSVCRVPYVYTPYVCLSNSFHVLKYNDMFKCILYSNTIAITYLYVKIYAKIYGLERDNRS